jgi:surfactin synthase thioesterase subunit/MFS family permease
LFKYPTVRGLAGYLADDQPRRTGLLHELTRPIPAHEKLLSLVCIPHGGGNAVVFQPLANALPDNCSLYAVQLPGHDYARRDEEPQPLETVARQCVEEIKRDVTGPVALYGHCVGGAMAVEIARLLEADGVEVTGIFMGGTFPTPRLPGKFFEMFARLFPRNRWVSNRTVYETLRAMGGFTDVVDPEELSFAIRALRHDAQEAEDYYTRSYAAPEKVKVRAPIVCIIGQADHATEFYQERFMEWELFSDSVDLAVIPQAGHYFLKHQADAAAQIVVDQLAAQRDQTAQAADSRAVSLTAARSDSKTDLHSSRKKRPAVFQGRPSLKVFFLVVFGQTISLIGTGMTSFALGVSTYQKNYSVTDFTYIFVFTRLANVLLAPIGGAVADRWDRRRVMIVSDMIAACGTLLVVLLLWTNSLQLWHIYLTAFIGAVANAFQRPAYLAAISQLVPKQYLGRANGLVQIGTATGNLLAPFLAGLLVSTIGVAGTVAIDLATFLFAIGTLAVVRFPDTLFRRQEEEPLLQEVVKGWQYIARRRGLAAMVVFFLLVNFLTSTITVLFTPMVLAFESPFALGIIGSTFGIGILAGGLTMSAWGGTRRRTEGMIGFVVLWGLSIALMGAWPSTTVVIAGLLGYGFAAALVNAHWQALIQTKVGWELQGRVVATNRMLALSLMPLGNFLAGPLADKVFEPLMASDGPLANSVGLLIGVGPGRGMGLMMILSGVILALWTLLSYRYRPLRFMEDDLPDAIPDAVIVDDRDELQRQADRQLLSGAAARGEVV